MKKLITNYSFNAASKTVTFNDYTSIDQSKILLVTNTTDNIILYNFASPAKGGTVATNVLTLTYDTTSMSNSDKIQIYYDDEQDVLYYAQSLIADASITPTSGKRIEVIKVQVMQNPTNSGATQVTLNFPSVGDFITGWAYSDRPESLIGAVNEALVINLDSNGEPVSVNIKYKEV